MLLQGWSPAPKIAEVIKPQVVKASLIVMQAPPKAPRPAEPKTKPKPAPIVEAPKKNVNREAQSYRAEIYELVRQNWSRPPSARNGMSARLLVELIPTGEVVSVSVVEGSGNAAFDQAAEQAVRQARRFPVPDNNAQFERYFRRFYFLFQPEDLLR